MYKLEIEFVYGVKGSAAIELDECDNDLDAMDHGKMIYEANAMIKSVEVLRDGKHISIIEYPATSGTGTPKQIKGDDVNMKTIQTLNEKVEQLERKISRRWDMAEQAESNGQFDEASRIGELIIELQGELYEACIELEQATKGGE